MHCYRTAIVPFLLCRCLSVVALPSHRYRTGITLLLLLCCCSCCCYYVAPLLFHCRSTAITTAVDTQLHRYCTVVAPLLNRCRSGPTPSQRGYKQFKIELLLLYCHSNVASAVDLKVHTVVAPRGITRVTLTIGDCQERLSSSSEWCSTSQKIVKVETY